ncbi:MAG: hypothetical protein M3Z25_10265 [Actinomycetota bacterium]|nr:hypothetical protein [Actinomycetota bacterium]
METSVLHPPSGVNYFAFRDETGVLDADDLCVLRKPCRAHEARTAVASYLRNLAEYARGVGVRYEVFLREVGQGEGEELHSLLLTSMVSGRLAPLSSWLTARHGSGAFVALFKAESYSASRAPSGRQRHSEQGG